MDEIKKDYEAYIIESIVKFYTYYGIKFKVKESYDGYLINYFNFRLKYLPWFPREIFISTELQAKMQSHPNKPCIDNIITKLRNGNDINQHQSTTLSNSEYDDDLFNDWGLHHLHLSEKFHPNHSYFYERTEDLLFIKFINDNAYLIDILPHKNFSKKSLIGIIQNNWDQILIESAHTYTPDFSEAEITILRKKGIMAGINVNGRGYMMLGHGYSTSGDNSMAADLTVDLIRWIGQNIHLQQNDNSLFKQSLLERLRI
jgi:hypothetical protein